MEFVNNHHERQPSLDNDETDILEHPQCFGCQIATRQIVPPGGDIWRDTVWHLAHDARNVIPGFLVLGTIPHVTHLHHIPESDAVFGWQLLRVVRQMLAERFALADCVTFQNDHTSGHYHLWILPLYPQMRQFGSLPATMIPFLQWTQAHWNTTEKFREIEQIATVLQDAVSLWAEQRRGKYGP